jgi:hypothetical protein
VHPKVLGDEDAVEPGVLVTMVVGEAALARPEDAEGVQEVRGGLLPELGSGQVIGDCGVCCMEAVEVRGRGEVPISKVNCIGDGG